MLYYVSKLMVLCILIATGLIASGVYMEWKNIKTLKLKEITLSTIKGIIFIALNDTQKYEPLLRNSSYFYLI